MKTEARRILVVDDEAGIREALAGILADEGFAPLTAGDGEAGLSLLETEAVDLVLLDIWMPGADGLEILARIRELYPRLPVIMISGHGTIETAVQATRLGAYDFIEKPLSYDKVILAINNSLRLSRLEEENIILREQTRQHVLTGESAPIRNLRRQLERVAPTGAWVLIRGEHGTGKELVAQTIHRLSPAAHKPMVHREIGSDTISPHKVKAYFSRPDPVLLFYTDHITLVVKPGSGIHGCGVRRGS